MKKYFLGLFIALTVSNRLTAQSTTSDFPEIGKRCPYFILKNVQYYSKNEVSRDDMKGKWFILDFWSRYCQSCIEAMPESNRIQKESGGKLQYFMVGYDDGNIRPLFEKVRKYNKLDLPVCYDTVLFKRFHIQLLPFQIIVDDKGVVRAITTLIKQKQIDSLLSGYNPAVSLHMKALQMANKYIFFDLHKPYLPDSNAISHGNLLYQSLLTKWSPNLELFTQEFYDGPYKWSNFLKNGIQEFGIPAQFLYRIAYQGKMFIDQNDSVYGKVWPYPVFEIRDSSVFSYNGETGKNAFCYSLIVPEGKASDEYLKKCMQRDLKLFFGYNVVMEERLMPYWRLVATSSAKESLKTKTDSVIITEEMQPIATGFTLTNHSVTGLIARLRGLNLEDNVVLDETGIVGNIDITMEGNLLNFPDLKKALKKNGLDLIKNRKMMTVMVIRDPQDTVRNTSY